MKYFIITIDTEGDNLWRWKPGQEITTKNVRYLARFQELCSRYGFKPVWLSNWEMINDSSFVEFINKNVEMDWECICMPGIILPFMNFHGESIPGHPIS